MRKQTEQGHRKTQDCCIEAELVKTGLINSLLDLQFVDLDGRSMWKEKIILKLASAVEKCSLEERVLKKLKKHTSVEFTVGIYTCASNTPVNFYFIMNACFPQCLL